jgi:hypothetical protein
VTIDGLLQRLGVSRDEIKGLVLQGELPVTDGVLNRLLAEQLAKRETPVAAVRVEGRDHDEADVLLVARTRLVPPIRMHVKIEQQPDLPRSAVLGLRWSIPGAGPLALLAGPALAFFKALPPGVRMHKDHVTIDLRELLAANGCGELGDYVRRVQLHARAGGFVVGFEVGA